MITIKKAKINSVGYLEVEYSEKITSEDKQTLTFETSRKCNYDPHQDLKDAFAGLRLYLVELCEQANPFEIPEDEEQRNEFLANYKVTGFVIGGSDEHEGVTLIGRKMLAHNRVLNLISPFTKWEDEHNGYDNSYLLKIQVDKCCDEVAEYLNGKKAPNLQSEIEFPEVELQDHA